MALIIELLVFFAVAFVASLVYQIVLRKKSIGAALHLAAIFGMAVMLAMFLVGLVKGFLV